MLPLCSLLIPVAACVLLAIALTDINGAL